jgi:kynurenine formamidase
LLPTKEIMIEPSSRLIDLSHVVEHGMVTYPGLPTPSIKEYMSREESKKLYSGGTEFQIGTIEMVANTGTYIDSPFHRFAGGDDLAGIPLEKLADLRGVVVRRGSAPGRDINLAGCAPDIFKGKAVLIHTGWSRHWNTEQYYEGYPYLTRTAAEFLRDSGAVLVGIDSSI